MIFLKIFRSPRERDFGQKRTIWSGSVWYRIGVEIVPLTIKNRNLPLEKINRRNFEDVSSGSAIFKPNHQNFQDAPRESAILIDLNEDKIEKKSTILEDRLKIEKKIKGSKKPIVRRFCSIFDFFFNKIR